jgi:hypothetical protein
LLTQLQEFVANEQVGQVRVFAEVKSYFWSKVLALAVFAGRFYCSIMILFFENYLFLIVELS